MLLPTKQNVLFRDILDGFEITTDIADPVLAAIYRFIFNPLTDPPVFQDAGLQQAAFALRDIAEMEQLSSLEGFALFFEAADREIDSWTQQIIDETEEAQAIADNKIEDYPDEEYEPGPVVQAVATRPALSKYYVSFDESYHHAFVEAYKQLYLGLHQFFLDNIERSEIGNRITPEDLIQETLLQVWDSGKRESTDRRQIEKDLWEAAEKVCLKIIVQINRKHIKSMARVPDFRGESSLEIVNFEFRDWIAHLKARGHPWTYFVFELRIAGFIPREIAYRVGLDEWLVREMINTARNGIRQSLTGKFVKIKSSGSNWKFYCDSAGQWRWRRFVKGKWVQSVNGFNSKAECVSAARKLG